MMLDIIYGFDRAILDFIDTYFHNDFFDSFFVFITTLGNSGYIWIVLSFYFLFFKATRKAALSSSIALVLGMLICNMTLKPLVARIRPYEFFNYAGNLLIAKPRDYSFPSGHTVSSFASATAFFLYNKKIGAPLFVLASLIAFSRLYLYVHYPTDIFCGILLGILCGFWGTFIIKTVMNENHK